MHKIECNYSEAEKSFVMKIDNEEFERCINFGSNSAEYDGTFFGFLNAYYYLSKLVPKNWTVVDFGCGWAAQCKFFNEHKKYIGVDISDDIPGRFTNENVEHYVSSIKKFIGDNKNNFDYEKTFAICNYVPCPKEIELVRKTFKNIYVFYPSF